MTFRLWRVCLLLFGSGACALIYQVAWFRELRLIFGASTAASAAVLAVFMGGLGIGGAVLGKRADTNKNPLQLYANLEIGVAITAALTPVLVWLAQAIYIGIGGASTLGSGGATVLRLFLSVVVLAPSTVLMGGTLPSAARAVEREGSVGRQRVAALYGINTAGAVVGTIAANFFLLELFGTQLTLWMICLVNVLIGLLGRAFARSPEEDVPAPSAADVAAVDEVPPLPTSLKWFPPLAASVAGVSFTLMELVWYRMLAPLLGGSSYTFGLILAIALIGIGIGGALYARTRRPATLTLFAVTCALEALAIAIPYAIGDRLAILSLLLRSVARLSFGWSIGAWSAVACIAVLPAAIVSGFQFPAIIGLYGRGKTGVGRDVGNAYLANTLGSIVGSIAGGFGLLPLLTAPKCWILVVAVLVATAVLALVYDVKSRGVPLGRALGAGLIAVFALVAVSALGPTAAWRHSGIGAGRADAVTGNVDADGVESFVRRWRGATKWDEEGLESTVALGWTSGYAFIVNGKVDGHSVGDAPTQVMSGLVASLLHPAPKSTLIVGLGTGSTAGWLAAVPEMERVDVVELEPSILRVARDCAPVNHDVMNNPKVHIQLGDAREVLRTTKRHYDIIFSEPSNPYRAGISSMYTVEYYRSAAERLNEGGYFVQWLQAYEVDGWAVATVLTTLRQVFPSLTIWSTTSGDLLVVAEKVEGPGIDMARIKKRVAEEPYASAIRATWKTWSAEGVLSHHVGARELADRIVQENLGSVNTDDQNLLEFAFARSVGVHRRVDDDVQRLGVRLRLDAPKVVGALDLPLLQEETYLRHYLAGRPADPPSAEVRELSRILSRVEKGEPKSVLASWRKLGRDPRTLFEAEAIARVAAHGLDPDAERFLALLPSDAQREIMRSVIAYRRNDNEGTRAALDRAFTKLRTDPWVPMSDVDAAFDLAKLLARQAPPLARPLAESLAQPFAVELARERRILTRISLARMTRDPKLCIAALDEMTSPLWDPAVIETRADCFAKGNDPRLAVAEQDYSLFLVRNAAFGANIASPPPLPRPARPALAAPGPVESPAPALGDGGSPPDGGSVDGGAVRDAASGPSNTADGGR